jgi:hypothetical protein
MKTIPANNKYGQPTERKELPLVKVKELCEDEVIFKINKMIVKENVVTDFSDEPETRVYMEIEEDGVEYFCPVNQTALVNTLVAMKKAADEGDEEVYSSLWTIKRDASKTAGRTYYNLYQVVEE